MLCESPFDSVLMRAMMRALACATVTSTSALRVGLPLFAQRSPLAPPSRAAAVRATSSVRGDGLGTRDLNGRDAEERQASSHVFGQPRPIVDVELSARRKAALDAELALVGIDPAALLADPALASSSGIKAYQTFVAPREAKLEHAANEALEPAAKRTAQQVAFLTRRKRAELAEFVRNHDMAAEERERRGVVLQPLVLVLDNVRSAYNVGSILRTAETAGVRKVVMCGLTPTPPHEKLAKTAFSAQETVPTEHYESTLAALRALQAEGYAVYAAETTARSRSYVDVAYPRRASGVAEDAAEGEGGGGAVGGTALVMGNEVTGVDTEALELCDGIVEIPTAGLKNSLNVAAACPVLVFEVLRQWGALDRAGEDGGGSGNTTSPVKANPVKPRSKPKWEEDVGGF